MKIKTFVVTDLNHLGATDFSTLRDPYFVNRCAGLWNILEVCTTITLVVIYKLHGD